MKRRKFPSAPASVADARQFVVDAVGGAPRRVVEAAAIAVSELATNCVRHAGTDFTVGVERMPDRLRVEVADTGAGVPALCSPDPSEPSGRGLLLVWALADDWGVNAPDDRPGKSVWFTIHLGEQTDRSLSDVGREGDVGSRRFESTSSTTQSVRSGHNPRRRRRGDLSGRAVRSVRSGCPVVG